MLSNLFGKKKITGKVRLYNADETLAFEGDVADIVAALYKAKEYEALNERLLDEGDEKVNLLQRIDHLEADNSRLGNAMFEIMKQATPGQNATVKRMIAIAKAAVFVKE